MTVQLGYPANAGWFRPNGYAAKDFDRMAAEVQP
jgi:hypothetical protein